MFVETDKKKKEKQPKPDVKEATKLMSEIKVTASITGEQIEADMKFKKLRKLKKKLRDIEDLEAKIKGGAKLEDTQMEKVNRKQEVIDEIDELED